MNTVQKLSHKVSSDEHKIRLLEARLESLEAALERYRTDKTESPADVAARWRKRLQHVGSPYRVFTLDVNATPLKNGEYLIRRVLQSRGDMFIVAKQQTNSGVIRKRATIEKWIEDLENVYTTNRK
jgi:hypothetical protein